LEVRGPIRTLKDEKDLKDFGWRRFGVVAARSSVARGGEPPNMVQSCSSVRPTAQRDLTEDEAELLPYEVKARLDAFNSERLRTELERKIFEDRSCRSD
jgi:hypothetical protein